MKKTMTLEAANNFENISAQEKENENMREYAENNTTEANDENAYYVDTLKQYKSEISKYKSISEEEEKALGWKILAASEAEKALQGGCCDKDLVKEYEKQIADGKAAKTALIEAHYGLVVSIASKYKYDNIEVLDLIQEGNMGLVKAADKFDVLKGAKFSTHATWWIMQAISRFANGIGQTVKVPEKVRTSIRQIKEKQKMLSNELGRTATISEIAEEIGMDSSKVNNLLCIGVSVTSLDKTIDEEEETTFGDTLVANSPMPEDNIFAQDRCKKIADALNTLPVKEAQVLKYRMGFLGRVYTLEEIHQVMGLSKARISQLETSAIKHLKDNNSTYKMLEEIYR